MQSPAAVSAFQLDPLPFRERTLVNGLRVISLEDHRSATVAVNVGYRVGGKDDPVGRSGFAHLFEHLMFKGTKNSKAETIDRITEDVGGYNNAYTADDLTNYYEVIPSNYLETILWAEADRLASLVVDETGFHTEREVVIGEYDQRILAEPYGMLGELVTREAYATHPYRRGVIGDPDNLRAATLEDVVAFHSTFYRPDNATLVVVGDFDSAEFDGWVDRYFGVIPTPPAAIPRVADEEPQQMQERRVIHHSASAPLPALQYAWHIGPATDADMPALDLIETLLGMGKSSRLYRNLVYTSQAATNAWAGADWREGPGLFEIRAIASAGHTLAELESLLDAEIESLVRDLVDDEELLKAKTQLYASMVRSRTTYNDIALQLVRSSIVRGTPHALDDDLQRYDRVDAVAIRDAARRTFTVANRTVVEYHPGGAQ